MKTFVKVLYTISLLLFLTSSVAFAQMPAHNMMRNNVSRTNNSRGTVTGTVKLNPDTPEEEPLAAEGAVVIISFQKQANNLANLAAQKAAGDKPLMDSLYAVIGSTGNFTIRNVPVGNATFKVTLMGYEKIERGISINPGENKIQVVLKTEDLTLSQSVVTAKVPPLSIVADTIVMNASAVKFNKGEMAIDILEQMPGVESTDEGVTVLGETIQNVYVDGVLLFGDSPLSALNNLPAEEVIAIKSFQEYANKDPRHKISQTESKERVLDISTKSKATFVINGNTLVGGGFDTDSTYHKFRYSTGATISASSEKLQGSVSVNVNNINNGSNRRRGASFGGVRSGGSSSPDLKVLNISLSGTKKWMSKEVKNYVLGQINGSYSYSNRYNVNESRSETDYFPTDQYDARKHMSSSKSITETGKHSFSVSGTKNIPDGTISLSTSYSINDGHSESYSSNYNLQKNKGASSFSPKQGTSSGTIKNTDGNDFSVNFNARKGFWNVLRVGFSASAGQTSSDAFSTKRDTTTQTITYKVLEIQSNTPSRNMSFSPNLRLNIGDRQSFEMSYTYRETYNKTEQFAYDITDPTMKTIDEINTNTMTNNNITNTFSTSYNQALWKDGPILRMGLSYTSVGLAKEETYPQDGVYVNDPYDHKFNSWTPSIRIGTEGMMNRWEVRYSTSNTTPSLEQVRPRLNNTNLYSVRGGNPNLKQSKTHNIRASFSTPLGDFEESTMNQNISTINVSASFSLRQNRIASNTVYFAQEGSLAEYGYPEYIMPAQSTFTTYVNVPDAYSANASVRYDTEIKFLRSNFNTNLSMNWDDTPEYVNSVLSRTENFQPSISLGLRSNFSRNFRFNLNGRGSYIYSYNSEKAKNEYFSESISGGVEVNNILQKGYVSGNYTKTFMQGVEYKGINDNILDLNTGMRFGPRNNFDISLMVHDLFNRTSGFSTTREADHVTNKWNHAFGRYVMLSLSYSFNSRKGGNSGGNSGSNNRSGGGFPGGNMGGMGGPGGMRR